MNNKIQTEVQRITNVLDETVQDLQILEFLPKKYSSIPQATLKKLSEPSRQALMSLYDEEKILSMKIDEKKASDVQEWSKKVKKAAVKVCQLLKKDRFEEYMMSDDQDKKLHNFVSLFEELQAVWIEKLNATEEEKQLQNELKNEIAAREKKANADRKGLERELAAEKSSREKELSIREDSLKKLQNDLKGLLDDTNAQKKFYTDKMDGKEKLAKQKYFKFHTLLTERIKRTKQLLSEMKSLNLERENEMKLNRKNAEKQVEDIVSEYDSYMSRTTLRVNQLMKEHKDDSQRIEFLQEELKKCYADKQQKEEAYKLVREEKMKIQEDRNKRTDAANVIGRAYKKVLLRRDEVKKAQKKKKKRTSKSPAKK